MLVVFPLATIAVLLRGQGIKTSLLHGLFPSSPGVLQHPTITRTTPDRNAGAVPLETYIAAEVSLPNAGQIVDAKTVNGGSVRLMRRDDQMIVPSFVNTSAAGDVVVLRPRDPLEPNTQYKFEVLPALRDTAGASFARYTANFTTSAPVPAGSVQISFEKVALPDAVGQPFTGATVGPDGRLYACTREGTILRFVLNGEGKVDRQEVIATVRNTNGGPRIITGICFDPASIAGGLVMWVSHGQASLFNADDWTGKISRLSGPDLTVYEDVVVGLPRSVRDHLNNQLSFGPDGALYWGQASCTAMGEADANWGQRPERLLSAAILRLDPKLLPPSPLDVKTADGGAYDPFAAGAPLTIYASGVRNAFDLLWHHNGHLYAPVNGSAAGGSTPPRSVDTPSTRRIDGARGPAPSVDVPSLRNLRMTAPDFLAMVEPGGYYGHPNPARSEFVMNGGNPTDSADPFEVPQYPVGTAPDRNWRRPVVQFGKSLAPTGILEYHGAACGGRLEGRILVARFSGGKDILVLTPGADGRITESLSGIDGFTSLADPLDIAENPATGFLYVVEYGAQRITLLRPRAGTSHRVFREQFPTSAAPVSSAIAK